MASELWRLAEMLSDEGCEDYALTLDDFADRIFSTTLHFPELADDYMVNMIHDSDYGYVLEEPELEELQKHEHPEYYFGFWRSFASQTAGFDIYVSSWAWILPKLADSSLPNNADILHLLETMGGFGSNVPKLINAQHLSIRNLPSIVLNSSSITLFPEAAYLRARSCVYWIRRHYSHVKSFERFHHPGLPSDTEQFNQFDINLIMQSEEGSVLIIVDELACYVFFEGSEFFDQGVEPINQPLASEYVNRLEEVFVSFSTFLGIEIDIACPWNQLDDEQFEEICYDVLRNSERFDQDRIHKM
jgi:hypothetical protein